MAVAGEPVHFGFTNSRILVNVIFLVGGSRLFGSLFLAILGEEARLLSPFLPMSHKESASKRAWTHKLARSGLSLKGTLSHNDEVRGLKICFPW